MHKIGTIRALIALLFALSAGCDMDKHTVSMDVTAFRNLIDTTVRIRSIRWEVFSTPEDTGGVPGPTDYVTLIAQIEEEDPSAEVPLSSQEIPFWIAPNSARPWLDEQYRSLLSAHENKPIDLSSTNHCQPLKARLRKTKEPIEGFICKGPAKALIYLTLLDRTRT